MWLWWVRIPTKDLTDVTLVSDETDLKVYFSVTRRSRSDKSHWLSHWVIVSIDFTDVTLVSDDTYRRLYWCDPDHSDDPDERYLVMKVI